MKGIENKSDVMLPTASNNKPGNCILHPLELINEIRGCTLQARSYSSPVLRKNKSRYQRFGRITGKVLTNGGNATQFYVGRCADIGNMLVQSKVTVNRDAQIFNLTCDLTDLHAARLALNLQ